MSLATVRSTLKNAIASNSNYSVYDHVPEVIIPPCVVLVAGDPYLEPLVVGNNKGFTIRFKIEVIGQTFSAPSALENLEADINTVLGLIPVKWSITGISSPRLRPTNSTDLYSVEIDIQSVYSAS
jgi:hypothetical protein